MSDDHSNPLAKLGLGTVQWGLSYGVSNHSGRTDQPEVARILDAARKRGVGVLDTAALYGQAEALLGRLGVAGFSVVTKTPKFDKPLIGREQANTLEAAFRRSLEQLQLDRTFGLLIHHAEDVLVPGGEHLIETMLRLKQDGLVERIGVSVYDGHQVDRLMERFVPDMVQVPINALDQRLLASGHLAHLKRSGVEIHARSVFLQGLLLMADTAVPAYFHPIAPLLAEWRARVATSGQTTAQAALAFVRGIKEIDKLIVGVESRSQFEMIADHMAEDRSFDASGLACDVEKFVNPARWVLSK